MRLGYNTNGLAHHSLPAAIELLADLGYQSVAITLDHATLNPYSERFHQDLRETAALLARHNLRSVIETGARYLLDSREKHEPTLVSADETARLYRIDFYRRAVDAAVELGSGCVSLWSGVVRHSAGRDQAFAHLAAGVRQVLEYAERRNVNIAFEPEPGMLVDTLDSFDELLQRVEDSPRLCLTLDVGHLHCLGETPIPTVISQWGLWLANVHIEDMRGVHEHLMFGEGEIDFPPIIEALAEDGYDGGVHVELSRHSHMAPAAAQQARDFLLPLINKYKPQRHEDSKGIQ